MHSRPGLPETTGVCPGEGRDPSGGCGRSWRVFQVLRQREESLSESALQEAGPACLQPAHHALFWVTGPRVFVGLRSSSRVPPARGVVSSQPPAQTAHPPLGASATLFLSTSIQAAPSARPGQPSPPLLVATLVCPAAGPMAPSLCKLPQPASASAVVSVCP